jgi:hypothetical protein
MQGFASPCSPDGLPDRLHFNQTPLADVIPARSQSAIAPLRLRCRAPLEMFFVRASFLAANIQLATWRRKRP